MLFTKKTIKKLLSAALSAAMLISTVPGALAAEDANAQLANFVAVKAGAPFYFKNGKQVTYGTNGYYPETQDGQVMIPLNSLKSMLNLTVTYDNKKEEAVMKRGAKTVRIRAGEDGIYTNETAKYIETKAKNPGDDLLVPFNTVVEQLGMKTASLGQTGITIAGDEKPSQAVQDKVVRGMVNNAKVLQTENFDGGEWTYQTWNGGSAAHELRDGRDGTAQYIGMSATGWTGQTGKTIQVNRASEYVVTVDIKKTEGVGDCRFGVYMWPYSSGGQFLGMINMTNVSASKEITTDWKTFTFRMSRYSTRSRGYDDFDNFYLNLCVWNDGSGKTDGGLLFDNLVLEEYVPRGAEVSCDFVADKEAAWYYAGDTVTFKAENPDAIASFKNIYADVYNGDGEKIYEKKQTVKDITENGFSYKPEKMGYFEVKFYAEAADGTIRPIVKSYWEAMTNNAGEYCEEDVCDDTYSFAVVKGAAKPMEERNDMLMASISPYTENELEYNLLDKVGISGLRLHAIYWGDGWGNSGGVEKSRGNYVWTSADQWVEHATKYGFKHITANIFSTPRWAVEEKWQRDEVSYMYLWQKMPPENMEDLANFIKEFYNHYKGKVDVLEFWNEPYYGNTAFWAGSPDDLKEMTKTAYTALREVDPDATMKMAAHAWNQGYTLYREVTEDEEYWNSFDVMSYHSSNGADLIKYQTADKDHGYESKPVIASEEYLYAGYKNGVKKDHRHSSMYFMSNVMGHFKKNLLHMAMFECTDNVPDEHRVWWTSNNNSASHVMGLFSPWPHAEPHKGAVVAYNLFENMGKEFKHNKEYDFGDGQKAVYWLNDGEPLVIVWNSENKNFYLSEELKSALGENAEITTFEGNVISLDDELKAQNMYYVKGFDKDKLDAVKDTPDSALNDNFESPYYTCKLPDFEAVSDGYPEFDGDKIETWTYQNSEKPFNEKTWKLSDNVEWTTDGWNWVKQNHDMPAGYAAKFATHIDMDGFWLVVDVTDSTYYSPTDAGTEWTQDMWSSDSIQFAIDCMGNGDASKRAEFQVGNINGEDVIFKHVAPDISFAMLEDFHGSSQELDPENVHIEKTSTGIRYFVYLPIGELYPFVPSSSVDHARFSLLTNNNDGEGRSYYEWSSGIGGDKDPKLFGAVRLK